MCLNRPKTDSIIVMILIYIKIHNYYLKISVNYVNNCAYSRDRPEIFKTP